MPLYFDEVGDERSLRTKCHQIYNAFRCWKKNKHPAGYLIDRITLRQLKYREGKCDNCGNCCVGCQHLNPETKKCVIYGKRTWCNINFPVSEYESKHFGKPCAYSWKH